MKWSEWHGRCNRIARLAWVYFKFNSHSTEPHQRNAMNWTDECSSGGKWTGPSARLAERIVDDEHRRRATRQFSIVLEHIPMPGPCRAHESETKAVNKQQQYWRILMEIMTIFVEYEYNIGKLRTEGGLFWPYSSWHKCALFWIIIGLNALFSVTANCNCIKKKNWAPGALNLWIQPCILSIRKPKHLFNILLLRNCTYESEIAHIEWVGTALLRDLNVAAWRLRNTNSSIRA